MNRQLSVIVLFVLLFTCNIVSNAQKIFISPNGNDSNPGSADKPLASLTGARDRLREMRKSGQVSGAIEVVAMQGEYFMMQPLELTAEDSGNPGSPVTFTSESGKKAVFRGGVKISGFVKVSEKLWKAFIPNTAYYNYYFEQLYINGRRATRARTPDEGFRVVKKVSETILEKGSGRSPELAVQRIEIDPADSSDLKAFTPDDYRDALIVFYHNWDNTRKRITGYGRTGTAVYTTGEGMKPWNPINAKSRYIIENYKGALDSPGEWYLDRSGWLWYIPEEGQTIENTVFHAPVLKEFIKISGDQGSGKKVENLKFENLTFEVAAYHTPADGNEPMQAAASVDAVVTLDYARNIEFNDCEISHTGTYAFWFRRANDNCAVNRCYLHDLGAGGVKIGETVIRSDAADLTKMITVDNKIIRDGGHVFPCAVGVIIFHASDNKVTHNEIADLRYSGISVGWVWGYAFSPSKRNKIEFNHIHHLGWGELCDMGGVYSLGASEGTTVSNNVIHHVYSFDYGGWGLYTDEGSFGIVEENNLVYACKSSGFHQHYGKENIIRNNIFAFNIRSQLQATRVEEHRSISFTNNIIYYSKGMLLSNNWHKFNLITDYNCYWDTRTKEIKFTDKAFTEWQKAGKDQHSLIADPMFTNAGAFDFHFKNQSVVKKIKFTPFDYSKVGVYGSDEWKMLAQFDKVMEKKFDEIVEKLEKKSGK